MSIDISVTVAGKKFAVPIFNASGPKCTTREELIALGESNAGGIVSKSCTLEPREGNPEPRYKDVPLGSINSMGLPNKGYQFYIDLYPELAKHGKPIWCSVSGLKMADNLHMIEALSESPELDAIELNLSCPNVVGKPQMGYDFEQSKEILAKVAEICKKPLGVKLPPYFDFSHYKQMAEILNNSTVQFVTCINSVGNGLIIDPEKEEVLIKPKGGFGGIGGPMIKPVGLANVRKFRQLLKPEIQVIGVGGIVSGIDAFEYILAGADAVQVGTVLAQEGPAAFERIAKELQEVMERKGYTCLAAFRNKLKEL